MHECTSIIITFFHLIQRTVYIWSGAVYISKFFPVHKRDGKLGFLTPFLHIWSNGEAEGGLSVR